MHKRTTIQLNAAARDEPEAVVLNRNSPQKHAWWAKIVLLTADGHGSAQIMQRTGKAKTVIWRWQERFGEEGVSGLWRDKTRHALLAKRRLNRCVFHSVQELKDTIHGFIADTNSNPKPFIWTKDPEKIIAAVKRGHQVLDSIH